MTVLAHTLTWWTIFRTSLQERLVYRGDFALGTLMRFLPIVTQIFLWWAVFAAVRTERGAESQSIAGWTYYNFVAYYLLTMVSRAFSSMPGLASGIALQIREGEIKKYLIQPVDMVAFLLVGRIAHKLAYYTVAAGPFVLVFILCRGYFNGWPGPITLAAYVASLLMAFLLGYFLEASIGMAGFWFLIPWLWFRTHDLAHLLYAIAVNVILLVGMIPEMRQYLRLRREGKVGDLSEVMQLTAMGRGMYKIAKRFGLLKVQPTVNNERTRGDG